MTIEDQVSLSARPRQPTTASVLSITQNLSNTHLVNAPIAHAVVEIEAHVVGHPAKGCTTTMQCAVVRTE